MSHPSQSRLVLVIWYDVSNDDAALALSLTPAAFGWLSPVQFRHDGGEVVPFLMPSARCRLFVHYPTPPAGTEVDRVAFVDLLRTIGPLQVRFAAPLCFRTTSTMHAVPYCGIAWHAGRSKPRLSVRRPHTWFFEFIWKRLRTVRVPSRPSRLPCPSRLPPRGVHLAVRIIRL